MKVILTRPASLNLLEDEITCEVGVKALDPTPGGTSFYMDVMVKGYEISYYRKDTGKNVPATFTGNTNTICEVDSTASFGMIICRASQKEMPPLQDLVRSRIRSGNRSL